VRHLREIVEPFVDPAVSVVTCLVVSISEFFQVTFQMIEKERLDRIQELRLVVLDGDEYPSGDRSSFSGAGLFR
jgi:hypothetical protein